MIGAGHIEPNGWIFPYDRMNKGLLKWFLGTLAGWVKSSPDPDHKQWIEAMVETFQNRLAGVF